MKMRTALLSAAFVFVGAVAPTLLNPAGGSAAAQAARQEAPTLAEAAAMWEGNPWKPDRFLYGEWFSGYPTEEDSYNPDFVPPNPIPLMEPEAAEGRRIRVEGGKGRFVFAPTMLCHPWGMPYRIARSMGGGFEVRIAGDEIIMMWPDMDYRRIYMDGRKHPAAADYAPTYNGHSIGHWENKRTLVIDTYHLRGSNTQIEPYVPKPEGSRLVERYTFVEPGLIEAEFTMTNPRFTKPWVVKWNIKQTPTRVWNEALCVDGSRYVMGDDGALVMAGPTGQALEQAEE